MKDDTRLFALAEGRDTGTAGSTPSTARRGTTVATCQTVAYRDASMAVTTSGAARTAGPGDDHAAGVVAPLHWSDVDIIQRGHYHQQCGPRRLVRTKGLTARCWHHEFSQGMVCC
jgi:hypothetical protein